MDWIALHVVVYTVRLEWGCIWDLAEDRLTGNLIVNGSVRQQFYECHS